MIHYSFDSDVSAAVRDDLSKVRVLNDCFNKFIKKCLLLDNMTDIIDICNANPVFDEERRILNILNEDNRIYISNKELPLGYQAARLSRETLKHMSSFTRLRIAIGVLNILSDLEEQKIYPGAIDLHTVVYDSSFKYNNVMLGSVVKYQVGCLRQLFPVEGYDADTDPPLYFDSKAQHTANARLILSILTPCGDSLNGVKFDDPFVMFLRLCDDCPPAELIKAILSHLEVSWYSNGLTTEDREELSGMILLGYPDVIPVTPEEVERYRTRLAGCASPAESAEAPAEKSSDAAPAEPAEKPAESVPEEPPEDPAHEPPDLVAGRIGMCVIVPPFTQTTETDKFREQIALVQASAAAALRGRTKDLEIAYFWANNPEDVHDFYGKSSHTAFRPFDVSYFPPILPGGSKDASYIRSAYVSSETISMQTNLSRMLNVVLLPSMDTSDAIWVVERARKAVDDRNRVLFIHADEEWRIGINTDDPDSLMILPDEIRSAFSL